MAIALTYCGPRAVDPVANLSRELPELAEDPGALCRKNPSADSTVYDTTQVSTKPRVLSGPRLNYPWQLREVGISGVVILSLIVNADGALDQRSVKVLYSDHLEFEERVLAYVREAVFLPGCRHGQGVRVRMALPIEFRRRG